MTLHFELRYSDLVKAQNALFAKSLTAKIGFAVFGFIAVGIFATVRGLDIPLLFIIAITLLVMFAVPWLLFLMFSVLLTPFNPALGQHELLVSNDGVQDMGETLTTHIQPEDLLTPITTSNSIAVRQRRGYLTLLVPRRVFRSPEEERSFIDELEKVARL